MSNTKLTSVKILEGLYNKFKISTINNGMTLQKLTNRAINLYLEDEKFREQVESNDNLIVSSSKL
tara:strand:+ start:1022 stop:1216 length:195 start_codon:yes stop_codon:yes gene_type:complete